MYHLRPAEFACGAAAINFYCMLDQFYSFKHWASTILMAPFLLLLYSMFPSGIDASDFSLLFFLSLLFAPGFSAPTFFAHYLLLRWLIQKKAAVIPAKCMLIGLTLIGIFITTRLVGGTLTLQFAYAYAVSAVITGCLFSIRKSDEVNERRQVTE